MTDHKNDETKYTLLFRSIERVGLPSVLVVAFLYGGYRDGSALTDAHTRFLMESIDTQKKQAETLEKQTVILGKIHEDGPTKRNQETMIDMSDRQLKKLDVISDRLNK